MFLNPVTRKILVQYPFKPAAYQQRSNHGQAIAVQSNFERSLIRDNLVASYDDEMQKAVSAGSVVKLSVQEMKEGDGPIHYLAYFPVIKPGSVTTKVQIVANSKINYTGLFLNDVVEPGPNSLTPLLDVLIQFRGLEVVLLFDLCKAFQQLVTGNMERHLRRLVYRISPNEPWEVYC